jgi:hypothetical protein
MADQSTAVKHTGEDKAAIKADPANVRAADSAGPAADLAISSGSGASVRASGKSVPVRVATTAIAPFVSPGSGPFKIRSGASAMAKSPKIPAKQAALPSASSASAATTKREDGTQTKQNLLNMNAKLIKALSKHESADASAKAHKALLKEIIDLRKKFKKLRSAYKQLKKQQQSGTIIPTAAVIPGRSTRGTSWVPDVPTRIIEAASRSRTTTPQHRAFVFFPSNDFPESSSSSSSSDSNNGGNGGGHGGGGNGGGNGDDTAEQLGATAPATGTVSKITTSLFWKGFHPSIDKQNHLKEAQNWRTYQENIMTNLMSIGFDWDFVNKLTVINELKIAALIRNTCLSNPL